MDTRTAFRLLVANIPGTWEKAAELCGNAPDPMRQAWGERNTRYVPNALDAQIVSDYAINLQTPHCYAYVRAVAENVQITKRHGNDVVVVVSAMGKATDNLIALASQVSDTISISSLHWCRSSTRAVLAPRGSSTARSRAVRVTRVRRWAPTRRAARSASAE